MSSNEDYIVVFQDEVHFQVTTSVTYVSSKSGQNFPVEI